MGFDAYSYGIRDVSGQKVHMSRPKDFANADFVEGDVIGLEICLPSLSLHRKVAEGTYNKAVDVSDDLDPMAAREYLDIIRDRVPIRFKNTLYFGKLFFPHVYRAQCRLVRDLFREDPFLSTSKSLTGLKEAMLTSRYSRTIRILLSKATRRFDEPSSHCLGGGWNRCN